MGRLVHVAEPLSLPAVPEFKQDADINQRSIRLDYTDVVPDGADGNVAHRWLDLPAIKTLVK